MRQAVLCLDTNGAAANPKYTEDDNLLLKRWEKMLLKRWEKMTNQTVPSPDPGNYWPSTDQSGCSMLALLLNPDSDCGSISNSQSQSSFVGHSSNTNHVQKDVGQFQSSFAEPFSFLINRQTTEVAGILPPQSRESFGNTADKNSACVRYMQLYTDANTLGQNIQRSDNENCTSVLNAAFSRCQTTPDAHMFTRFPELVQMPPRPIFNNQYSVVTNQVFQHPPYEGEVYSFPIASGEFQTSVHPPWLFSGWNKSSTLMGDGSERVLPSYGEATQCMNLLQPVTRDVPQMTKDNIMPTTNVSNTSGSIVPNPSLIQYPFVGQFQQNTSSYGQHSTDLNCNAFPVSFLPHFDDSQPGVPLQLTNGCVETTPVGQNCDDTTNASPGNSLFHVERYPETTLSIVTQKSAGVSRSHDPDLTLTHTPRGTGCGYGIVGPIDMMQYVGGGFSSSTKNIVDW